jgi:hypothetical protein
MKVGLLVVSGLALVAQTPSTTPANPNHPKPTAPVVQPPKPVARKLIGSDIEVVIQTVLKSLGDGKGEFETTEEFDDRRAAVLEKIGVDRTFLIVQPARYDADDGNVYFDLTNVVSGRYMKSKYEPTATANYLTIELKTKMVSERVYIGQNSFGVKAKITEARFMKYGLVLRTDSPIKFQDVAKVGFPMDRPHAREILPWLYLCVQGKLISATINDDFEHSTPTVNDPFDTFTFYSYVPFRVDRAFVANIRSGETVHTFQGMSAASDH